MENLVHYEEKEADRGLKNHFVSLTTMNKLS